MILLLPHAAGYATLTLRHTSRFTMSRASLHAIRHAYMLPPYGALCRYARAADMAACHAAAEVAVNAQFFRRRRCAALRCCRSIFLLMPCRYAAAICHMDSVDAYCRDAAAAAIAITSMSSHGYRHRRRCRAFRYAALICYAAADIAHHCCQPADVADLRRLLLRCYAALLC